MASTLHFKRFRGIKPNMTHNLTEKYMQKMVVREPQLKIKNLHPAAKIKWNKMTQAPLPLDYKLHPWPIEAAEVEVPKTLEEELILL